MKRLTLIILAILALCIRLYYTQYVRPFRVERYELVPKISLSHKKTHPHLIVHYGTLTQSPQNLQQTVQTYAKTHKIDYFKSAEQQIWQIVLTLFDTHQYEYIWIIPANVYVNSPKTSYIQLLREAGDSEMILARNEREPSTVNSDVILFHRSEWTLYKLHQLYYESLNNSSPVSVSVDTLLEQVYVNYQHKTLEELKDYIDQGVPYKLTNICVYNEHALVSTRSVLLRYIDNAARDTVKVFPWKSLFYARFGTLETTPNFEVQVRYKRIGKIPKLIFQTMESSLTVVNVKQCIDQIRQLNPDYKYYYFTSYDCRVFIARHYPQYLEAYDALLPGAYKADFWRYCILHKYGGFYLDCRMLPYSSFDSIIAKTTEFMSCIDVNQNMIYQAILGATPRSPFIQTTIDLCIENINGRKMDGGDLNITGPKTMGTAVNKVLKRNQNKDLVDVNDPRIIFLKWNSFKSPKYLEIGYTIFACHKYTKLLTDEESEDETKYWIALSGKEHYSVLYRNKKVYKFPLLGT